MKIAIGSDHAGYELKEEIKSLLRDKNIEYQDFGTFSNESTDYPDYAHQVASKVNNNEFSIGILICGSGNGINMTANKYKNVRAALCWLPEIATLAKQHNDANIVSLPARYISIDLAKEIVIAFINENFEGGRHEKRVNKINMVLC